MAVFTNEFLEAVLLTPVLSFSVKAGSKPGENYLSDMYAIEVDTDGAKVQLMVKCFPEADQIQRRLIASNMFWNEVMTYKTFFAALQQLVDERSLHIHLSVPAILGGEAINFQSFEGELSDDIKSYRRNYLVMHNLAKTASCGLVLENEFGFDHVAIAIKELAKLHCLSCAYKEIHTMRNLSEAFPSLRLKMTPEWQHQVENSAIKDFIQTIPPDWPEAHEIIEGTLRLQGLFDRMTAIAFEFREDGPTEQEFENYMRIPPVPLQDEVPWRVAIHGDCWETNLMYRHNSEGLPVEVILIDFQMMREKCPTLDLVYLVYRTTKEEDRNAFCERWLQIYYEDCLKYFHVLKVSPFPGFCLKELKRRFWRAKIYAYFMNIVECSYKVELAREMYKDGII